MQTAQTEHAKRCHLHLFFTRQDIRERKFSLIHRSGETGPGFVEAAGDEGVTLCIIKRGLFGQTLQRTFVFYDDIIGYNEFI